MSRGGSHRESKRGAWPWLAGLLALLLVLGVGYVAVAALGGDDDSSAGDPGAGEPSASDAGSPGASESPSEDIEDHGGHDDVQPTETAESGPVEVDADATCEEALAAADDVFAAARIGNRHWKAHTGAYLSWRAGEISEDEKAATYKRTRLAGPDDQIRFTNAMRDYRALVNGCDDDGLAAAPDGCAERLGAVRAGMRPAKGTMADWEDHLANMAAHAAGEFDATEAQRRWSAALAAAPVNQDGFDDAFATLEAAPSCG